MPSDEQIVKYTKWLGLINGFIPVGFEIGLELKNLVENAQASGGGEDIDKDGVVSPEEHAQAIAEAKVELAKFAKATVGADHLISGWIETHPRTADA